MGDFTTFDRECMALALQLARQGWYTAHPNPRVGCVLARDDSVVGRGYHQRAGEPHAEINAITDAGDQARGAVAYVTLEPCNHTGRTGPCSKALIEAGVSEVIYAVADPSPLASGGAESLRAAGVKVRGPLMETEARALNAGFFNRIIKKRPYVTVKLAMSLDGRTAMASGESKWITGPEARGDVQKLRAQSGAVITGAGTVLTDDPAMTVRESQLLLDDADEIAKRQPLRVVVDSGLRASPEAAIFRQDGPLLIATCAQADAGQKQYPEGVEILSLPEANGHVSLPALLEVLAKRECNDVLVEAGSELAGAFVAQGLVDRLIIYVAAKLMGSAAKPLLGLPFSDMNEAVELDIENIRAVGDDWRISATLKTAQPSKQ